MPTRKQLLQRHPESNPDKTRKLRALYAGGDAFKELLNEFLPKQPHEPDEQYTLRKKLYVYRNYVGPVVDYFASLLFVGAPVVQGKRPGQDEPETELPEYYSKFEKDCDRSGANLVDAFKELLTDAMVVSRAWVWLQHPHSEASAPPVSLADFQKRGIGDSWLRLLKDEQVLDWETDDAGNLEMVLVFEESTKRTSLAEGRDTVVETWHHIQPDKVDVYQLQYKLDKPPVPDTEVPLVTSYPHRYGTVPVVCMWMPPALWAVERIESPQLAHFRLSNMQMWGMSRSCYAMPVFKRDSEESEEPRMGAGYGIYIGIKESLEWAAPPVDCYDALGNEIKSHKDEIYRIAHTMALGVENNAAAVGRSAESKMADALATDVVMRAYARLVRECIERVYDLISVARGDDFQWSIGGMDDSSAETLPGLVEMLKTVHDTGGIQSKTFNVEMKARLAEAFLPDLDQQTKAKIRKELEEGVPEPGDEDAAEEERLHKAALKLTGRDANGSDIGRDRARGGGDEKAASSGRGGGAAAASA